MATDVEYAHTVHAGRLIARRLKASRVDTVFTLSGGHLFLICDGCRSEGIRLIDTRHEQTAAFAAEGWSKVTGVPGVVALTAGPRAVRIWPDVPMSVSHVLRCARTGVRLRVGGS